MSMESTIVKYRRHGDVTARTFDGPWMAVKGGIVLRFSEQSEYFVPFHNIECIDQIITGVDSDANLAGRRLSRRLK